MTDLLTPLVPSFERSLKARRRSPKTIKAYVEAARLFTEHQSAAGSTLDPAKVQRGHVEDFIAAQLEQWSPSTAATRYRCLQQFWKWVVEIDEAPVSPMEKMHPPSVPEAPVPVFTTDDLKALLATTKGKGFDNRRDAALIRLFIATGVRLGEMTGITLEDLKLEDEAVLVTGKGDRGRWVTFTPATAEALDLYLIDRRRHRLTERPELWLGVRGPLTDSGVTQVLRRRAKQAGIEGIHPHRFRHTFAHRWLAAGGTEGDLQELAGWRSPQMLARYGASARSERARAAYQRIDVEGDL